MKKLTLSSRFFVLTFLLFNLFFNLIGCSDLAFHVSNQKSVQLSNHEINSPLVDTFSEPFRHSFNLVTDDGNQIRVQSQSLKIDFQNLRVRANFRAEPKTAEITFDLIRGQEKNTKRLYGTFADLGSADLEEVSSGTSQTARGQLRARVRCVDQCARVVVDIYFRSQTRVFHKQFESELDAATTTQRLQQQPSASNQNQTNEVRNAQADPERLEMSEGEEEVTTVGEYATRPLETQFMANVLPLIEDKDLEIDLSVQGEDAIPHSQSLNLNAPSRSNLTGTNQLNPLSVNPSTAGLPQQKQIDPNLLTKAQTLETSEQRPAPSHPRAADPNGPAEQITQATTTPSNRQGIERRDGLQGTRNRSSLRGGHVEPLYPREGKPEDGIEHQGPAELQPNANTVTKPHRLSTEPKKPTTAIPPTGQGPATSSTTIPESRETNPSSPSRPQAVRPGLQSPTELIPQIAGAALNSLCRDFERAFRFFPCSNLGEGYRGQSTGFYNTYRGRQGGIINSTEVVERSPGLRSINRGDRIVYGSGITVMFLHKVGEELQNSQQLQIEVGDLSKQFGGRAAPHVSHQNGLDIDIRTIKTSTRAFDPERNWEFLKIMHRMQLVHRIFTSNENKQRLCTVARSRNEHRTHREIFQRLQYWRGHTTHFHVRLKCTGHNDQSCRKDESPLLPSGCE